MTFNDVMTLTRSVSSNTAFEDPECSLYFELLSSLPSQALVVEVGLEFGRSSAIALQVARERHLRYWGIDPFEGHSEAEAKWLALAESMRAPFQFSKLRSNQVVIGELIDLVLIDGDHSYQGVMDDCNHFLPQVKRGGFACLHDYGRDSLPEVYAAARDYLDGNPHWVKHAQAGTLGVWRRA